MNFTQQLEGAQSVDSVVALANQFLSDLPQDVVERFPLRCRPDPIADASAIHHWRRQLLAEVCTLPGTPDLRLQELAVFFLRASARAHALSASAAADPPPARIESEAA